MAQVHIDCRVRAPYVAFESRSEAGEKLAEYVKAEQAPDVEVLAVPRGGIPVSKALARAFGTSPGLVLTRKLPIPDYSEAGFGAVSLETGLVLNDDMVRRLHISSEQIDDIVEEVRGELRRRAREYGFEENERKLTGKRVFLVDDGLATGYTMIAAAQEVRAQDPREVNLAVPVSPADSIEGAEKCFDNIYCLIVQTSLPFAVANFYRRFPDLSDEQVRRELGIA